MAITASQIEGLNKQSEQSKFVGRWSEDKGDLVYQAPDGANTEQFAREVKILISLITQANKAGVVDPDGLTLVSEFKGSKLEVASMIPGEIDKLTASALGKAKKSLDAEKKAASAQQPAKIEPPAATPAAAAPIPLAPTTKAEPIKPVVKDSGAAIPVVTEPAGGSKIKFAPTSTLGSGATAKLEAKGKEDDKKKELPTTIEGRTVAELLEMALEADRDKSKLGGAGKRWWNDTIKPKLDAKATEAGEPIKLSGKLFGGAKLEGYDLSNVTVAAGVFFSNTHLTGTNLNGADLTAASSLSVDQMIEAKIDEKTKLPPSVTREKIAEKIADREEDKRFPGAGAASAEPAKPGEKAPTSGYATDEKGRIKGPWATDSDIQRGDGKAGGRGGLG